MCEVLLDYPKIGGGDLKYFVKKVIRNILRTNIDVHIRMFIDELAGDGAKFISKL